MFFSESKPFPRSRAFVIAVSLSLLLLNSCTVGIFSKSADDWIILNSPPSGVKLIVAVSAQDIWVESNDSRLFHARKDSTCDTDLMCWLPVTEAPAETALPFQSFWGNDCKVFEPANPAPNPKASFVECIYAPSPAGEYVAHYYFALMSDGSLMFLDNSLPFIPF